MFLLWFPVQCINWCCLCLTSKMFSVYENIDHRDFIRDNHWLPQITQHINSYFPWWTLSDPYMSLIQTVSNLNPLPQGNQAPAQPLVPYGKPPQTLKRPQYKDQLRGSIFWRTKDPCYSQRKILSSEKCHYSQKWVPSWYHLIPHFVMFHYFICLCTLRYTSLADPQSEFHKG